MLVFPLQSKKQKKKKVGKPKGSKKAKKAKKSKSAKKAKKSKKSKRAKKVSCPILWPRLSSVVLCLGVLVGPEREEGGLCQC